MIKNDSLPLRLIPFLEKAVELRFMHRVGGGYIFIHDLLRDHIAHLDLAEWEQRLAEEGLLDKKI